MKHFYDIVSNYNYLDIQMHTLYIYLYNLVQKYGILNCNTIIILLSQLYIFSTATDVLVILSTNYSCIIVMAPQWVHD